MATLEEKLERMERRLEALEESDEALSNVAARVEALESENRSLASSLDTLHKRQLTQLRTTASGRVRKVKA